MGAYILRRLLLVIPTLFGIMVINFALIQMVPGGPVEQALARAEGELDALGAATGGSGADAGAGQGTAANEYVGARGLPPEYVAQLEQQFGFVRIECDEGYTGEPTIAAPECRKLPIPAWKRFLTMMGNYLTFDFGESYFRSISVVDLVIEKLPVSISLGLWTTLLAYLVSIPLGIRKAVNDGSRFDTWTSAAIIVGYAIPNFLFAVLLIVLFAGGSYWKIFPLRGLTSDNWEDLTAIGRVADYLWHITLPVLAMVVSGFATLTLLTKNSFLDEIGKQYVMTARAKGLTERRVLYGHVFRNAMLIVIASFPGLFVSVLFTGALLIETIFSLDGLGRMGFEAVVQRDYPVVFATLFVFTLIGLLLGIVSDLMYVFTDPRIDFETRSG